MPDSLQLAGARSGPGRPQLATAWPLFAALATAAVAVPLVTRLGDLSADPVAAAILLALAAIAAGAGTIAHLRRPTGDATPAFVALAAATATILALAPIDRSAMDPTDAAFLLIAPWRYALTPLVVHFALSLGWPHRRPQWQGWVVAWYLLHLCILFAAVIGWATGELAVFGAINGTVRPLILEPAGVAVAALSLALGLLSADRRRAHRQAIGWALAGVVLGLGPLVLTPLVPEIGFALEGPVTPALLALALLPLSGLAAIFALPFGDPAARDLLAFRVAQRVLDAGELPDGLRELAEALRTTFTARGAAVRLAAPPLAVHAGEIRTVVPGSGMTPEIETSDDQREVAAPIGRAGDPLGEVRLEAVFAGAFARAERDWLTAFLVPIGSALRARRRELAALERASTLAGRVSEASDQLTSVIARLPPSPLGDGVAVPPAVDAREVLAQLSAGVTGVANHGGELEATAVLARERARASSDGLARALDALNALAADVARLGRHGDDIAASNDTVNGVAFRTNLLANNAALEATRAGAAGRTFGVLAEEIRRLADMTAAASVAIGERTTALAGGIAGAGASVVAARDVLAGAMREAEAAEEAARRLNRAANELEDAARSLGPAVEEANAVARRRTARDQHLTTTLDRFLDERLALAHALTSHRDAIERLGSALKQLTAR